MIKVLLFAHLQEQVGKDILHVEVDNLTVNELKQALHEQYPLIELNRVMVAINEEYALDADIIKTGDTVAFIPPVSGG